MDPILTPILATAASTLLPSVVSGLGRAFDRLTGGAKPANVDEEVKLMQANTDRLKVVAELDRPDGTASQWVINVRQAFRYLGGGAAIVNMVLVSLLAIWFEVPEHVIYNSYGVAGVVFGWMYGERFILAQPAYRTASRTSSAPAPIPTGNPASGGR